MRYTYRPLTQSQIEIISWVTEGNTIHSFCPSNGSELNTSRKRKILSEALSQLRSGTMFKELPEDTHGKDCDYDVRWLRSNPESARQLVRRHQAACEAAEDAFWSLRKTPSAPYPDPPLHRDASELVEALKWIEKEASVRDVWPIRSRARKALANWESRDE